MVVKVSDTLIPLSTIAGWASVLPASSTSSWTTTHSTSKVSASTSTMAAAGAKTISGDTQQYPLVVILASVLTVVGLLTIFGGVFMYVRCKHRRKYDYRRGATPIDDEEIESWKRKPGEKQSTEIRRDTSRSHARQESVDSVRKPPSVIVYPHRQSMEQTSPTYTSNPRGTYASRYGRQSTEGGLQRKTSVDKILPPTPIQAVAPNAREGLTDESIPGDAPYVPLPQRQPSKLTKPLTMSSHPPNTRYNHNRTRSTRSTASLTNMRGSGEHRRYASSDLELSRVRTSYESYMSPASTTPQHQRFGTTTIISGPCSPSYNDPLQYSSSSLGLRSPSSESFVGGGLSPRPLRRDFDLGRSIG